MKPSFHHRPVNGPFEDPSLYIRLFWERRALMFDVGTIDRLGPGEMLKITDIFVSHTHIDHFIGFDTVLRALLRRQRPLNVYGPEGIIDCVEGKLKGYTWNLIKEYPLGFEVFEINGSLMRRASFEAKNTFARLDRGDVAFAGTALRDAFFSIKTAIFRHDIPCLGFALEEDYHININKSALLDMGLPVGPWLSDLKRSIRTKDPEEKIFYVDGRQFSLKQLRPLATITEGQKITYIVDAAPDEENIKKAVGLARGSDTLYCEAYFLDSDMERARERNHLTAGLAGRIAREAGVKNLLLLHFSPKYRGDPDALQAEATRQWKGG